MDLVRFHVRVTVFIACRASYLACEVSLAVFVEITLDKRYTRFKGYCLIEDIPSRSCSHFERLFRGYCVSL